MSRTHAKKKLLVLSDNQEIALAIESILGEQVDVSSWVLDLLGSRKSLVEPDAFDLIMVVLSEYTSEPVVALARASLGHVLNRVPMLIVSDKFFKSSADTRIVHMDFPFTAQQLQTQVDEMLRGKFLPASDWRRRARVSPV
jgi:hypothetical protein